MKTNNLLREGKLIAIVLIPFVYLAFIWNQLPESVPMHYGPTGEPDRYGSKNELVISFGILNVFMYVVFGLLPRFDPKGKLSAANYGRIRTTTTIFTAILTFFMFYTTHVGWQGDTFMDAVFVLVFLLLAGLGNFLNTVPPNYFVGFKTPWTLESEDVWRQTHRVASRWWVIGGLMGALGVFFIPAPFKLGWVLTITLVLAALPYVYSYRLFRQRKFNRAH